MNMTLQVSGFLPMMHSQRGAHIDPAGLRRPAKRVSLSLSLRVVEAAGRVANAPPVRLIGVVLLLARVHDCMPHNAQRRSARDHALFVRGDVFSCRLDRRGRDMALPRLGRAGSNRGAVHHVGVR